MANVMMIKQILVIVLCIVSLTGCVEKVPAGISDEMYNIGQEAVIVTEKFLDGDKSRRDTVDEMTDLGSKSLDICTKEDENGTLDEEYNLDKLVGQTILLIAQEMCSVDGEEIESSLNILKELLE